MPDKIFVLTQERTYPYELTCGDLSTFVSRAFQLALHHQLTSGGPAVLLFKTPTCHQSLPTWSAMITVSNTCLGPRQLPPSNHTTTPSLARTDLPPADTPVPPDDASLFAIRKLASDLQSSHPELAQVLRANTSTLARDLHTLNTPPPSTTDNNQSPATQTPPSTLAKHLEDARYALRAFATSTRKASPPMAHIIANNIDLLASDLVTYHLANPPRD
jgi:hypothetical protein